DLNQWSLVWVEGAGRPTIKAEFDVDSAGRFQRFVVTQEDPLGTERVWPQQLEIFLGTDQVSVELNEREQLLPEAIGKRFDGFVLLNGNGLGYGRFEFDWESLSRVSEELGRIAAPVTRASAWLTLWDTMLEGNWPPDAMVRLLLRGIQQENEELILQHLLDLLESAFWQFLTPEKRQHLAGEIEGILWTAIAQSDRPGLSSTYFRTLQSVALTEEGLARLGRIFRAEEELGTLRLSLQDREELVFQLAIRSVAGVEEMMASQRAETEDPERLARFDFLRPAVSSDRGERDALFSGFAQIENRQRETWVLEALRYLNHPLYSQEAVKYLRPGLELLLELQQTGTIFFPKRWLDALFWGHQDVEAYRVVSDFLRENPDYPERLKGKILQSTDTLSRAVRILEGMPASVEIP
ncbi:MAG: ERAP1-like C-terminal domain-containing protein, partial [Acidobacteriota bacterium]